MYRCFDLFVDRRVLMVRICRGTHLRTRPAPSSSTRSTWPCVTTRQEPCRPVLRAPLRHSWHSSVSTAGLILSVWCRTPACCRRMSTTPRNPRSYSALLHATRRDMDQPLKSDGCRVMLLFWKWLSWDHFWNLFFSSRVSCTGLEF